MSDSMRAVVIARYGGSLEATRRPVPRPGPGEVLVQVRASGLCSTDLHLLSGRQPLGDLPRVVGHELAGDVVELGAGVTDWRPGDRVTAAIDVCCGRCRHCLTGATQRCRAMQRIGFERDGGHADYVAVPASNLVLLGAEISYAAAAILPDAVACMYHSLIHQGGVGIGQRVLILGVGGLGIHGVQIARSAGAEVLATSRQPQRVALAEQHGAIGVNTADEALEAAVARFTDGEGVDVVVDNIGNRESVRQGLAVLRPGGRFLVVAYLDETFEVPSMRLFKTEQQIVGCRGSTRQDLIDVVRLVQSGRVTPVLGASYPLERIQEAAACLESGDLVGRIWLSRD
ncbi:MAG: zinc-binding dehydrogenase [Betaproteobacteria bacterium]|nr:zinc-binding dehydrogenase [Betaproteobacteria bacterium]MBK6601210.1 zinc-binding dehydrogenase [Betaproteobacteria bacterium]MBK9702522.1 zinc-binding dehydrogenase [Betaproteobacteria bacterium]